MRGRTMLMTSVLAVLSAFGNDAPIADTVLAVASVGAIVGGAVLANHTTDCGGFPCGVSNGLAGDGMIILGAIGTLVFTPSAGVGCENGSCHTSDCASVPFGALWALPGGTVSWATNDLGAPSVTVNGTKVATDANGQIAAPVGATVVLLDGPSEIDRLVVP